MPAPSLTEKNEIKIFILFLMNSVNYPLTYDEISEIVVYDNFVVFSDFVECFSDLLNSNMISEVKTEEGNLSYEVSPSGKTVAVSLQDSIVQYIRDKAYKSALRILSFKKKNATVNCVISVEGNSYIVSCDVRENGELLMHVDLSADTLETAEKMKKNFYERPEVIFKVISALLSGEVDYLFN